MNALHRTLPLALLLLGSCRLFHTPVPSEALVAASGRIGPAQDVEWEEANRGTARWRRSLVVEHLPVEASGRASRSYALEFVEGFEGTAEEFVEAELERLDDLHLSFYGSSIESTSEGVIYQWAIRGPSDIPDQAHLCRAVVGSDGLYRADYTRPGGYLSPDERRDWVRHLESLQLVPR
jgi:hypothetical protein